VKACTRCGGYIHTPGYPNEDPECVNCGCQFPELKQSNGNKKQPNGLRSAMRYSGKNENMRELVGYVTLKAHPSPGTIYPLLEVECPSCGELATSQNAQTNPGAESVRYRKTEGRIRTAIQSIYCTRGHAIRLKVDKLGRYTWD